MCLYPKLIDNPKYKVNKKNGGNIPPVLDDRVKKVPIGCQNCMECRQQKKKEWAVRLLEEVRGGNKGYFVTLTFSNDSIKEIINLPPSKNRISLKELEGYELDNEIASVGIRLFLERWRKEHKKSIRHWFITELGHEGTENIHIHGIVWTDEPIEKVHKHWKYGYVYPNNNKDISKNFVNEKTVNYIIKYVTAVDLKHREYKAKIFCSSGIGSGYINRIDSNKNKFNGNKTDETYKNRQGYVLALPIYYRNKLYSENEREKLWLYKLDKNERYICGEKISGDNDKEYYELLSYYRKLNKELKYGDDEKNWEQKIYETERRKLMYRKRLESIG